MSLAFILFKQIIIMFILILVGYLLFKTKKISLQGNQELGNFLIYVILPSSIVKSYITDFTMDKLMGLLLSFMAAVFALALSILVSRIVFGSRQRIEHFGTAFSNAAFIGIPLVRAAIGEHAVFYVASFVALLNILQWTYGVVVMSDSKDAVSPKKLITNPVVISLLIGLLLFFSRLCVPSLIIDTLGLISNMTAPVAMITLGVYLAQMKPRELFTEKWAYISTILRLIVIPLLTIGVLYIIPREYLEIKLTVLIAASAPVGANVAIFSQLHGLDYTRAVKSVCLSTIFSIITMPVIIALAQLLWR